MTNRFIPCLINPVESGIGITTIGLGGYLLTARYSQASNSVEVPVNTSTSVAEDWHNGHEIRCETIGSEEERKLRAASSNL